MGPFSTGATGPSFPSGVSLPLYSMSESSKFPSTGSLLSPFVSPVSSKGSVSASDGTNLFVDDVEDTVVDVDGFCSTSTFTSCSSFLLFEEGSSPSVVDKLSFGLSCALSVSAISLKSEVEFAPESAAALVSLASACTSPPAGAGGTSGAGGGVVLVVLAT